jgi:hypothetical protein
MVLNSIVEIIHRDQYSWIKIIGLLFNGVVGGMFAVPLSYLIVVQMKKYIKRRMERKNEIVESRWSTVSESQDHEDNEN